MEFRSSENSDFVPTHFLTVYSQENSNTKYLEIGNITKENNEFKVGASVPADKEFLNDLAALIKVTNFKALKFSGLIPDNVWYVESENKEPTIVWTKPAEKKYLSFLKSMGAESSVYQMPDLLFAVFRDELSVFRLNKGFKKSLDLKLYMVPLPNIYEESNVCLGNNRPSKQKTLESYMQAMEDVFYKTRFNALHHESFGKGVIWSQQIKSKNLNDFPLVLSKQKTLKNLLNELS